MSNSLKLPDHVGGVDIWRSQHDILQPTNRLAAFFLLISAWVSIASHPPVQCASSATLPCRCP